MRKIFEIWNIDWLLEWSKHWLKVLSKTSSSSVLKAEDASRERTGVYSLLPRTSATGWHAAAVPDEPESDQVKNCQSLTKSFFSVLI